MHEAHSPDVGCSPAAVDEHGSIGLVAQVGRKGAHNKSPSQRLTPQRGGEGGGSEMTAKCWEMWADMMEDGFYR